MKHFITFFPLGNADTTLIELNNGQKILWDFANKRNSNDENDKRCDLPSELNNKVKGDYNVVCFTHGDKDHYCGFSEYFYLGHAEKYQTPGRKRINELWVPATILIDSSLNDEGKILKAEARFRLKNKEGIKIFSRPKKMKEWCDAQEDISFEDVKHLFVDAGKLVPGYKKEYQGVEFFIHTPFYSETKGINRNDTGIVAQATFNDKCATKIIFGADISHEVWKDIVTITKYKTNNDKLLWDLFHISHHCSYTAISSDIGVEITDPIPEVDWLFNEQGRNRCRITSSSLAIPVKNSPEDNSDPPHRQAANFYKKVASKKNGEFRVTMMEPSVISPKPFTYEIDQDYCMQLKNTAASSAAFAFARPSPRAG